MIGHGALDGLKIKQLAIQCEVFGFMICAVDNQVLDLLLGILELFPCDMLWSCVLQMHGPLLLYECMP